MCHKALFLDKLFVQLLDIMLQTKGDIYTYKLLNQA